MMQPTDISIVTPVFNESKNIQELYKRLVVTLDILTQSHPLVGYEIIFVDDGSTDETLNILKKLHAENHRVKILSFSRNFGHQTALTAGIERANGGAIITMDSDLQDEPEDIPRLIEKWRQGYNSVYAIRVRRNETWLRTLLFKLFYKIFNYLSQTPIPFEGGDFCLMDRKVVNALKNLPERSRFLRALRMWIGFRHIGIPQQRPHRKEGSIKHNIKKLTRIALDGIFSFSYLPLRVASVCGLIAAFGGIILGLKILYEKFFTTKPIIGWSSLMVTIIFFSGIILLCLGIIGEYICRIYEESKKRPLYFINEAIGFDHES